ncbi:MAG: hypothetical protein P8Y85_02860 [Nitrospirota bacterium]
MKKVFSWQVKLGISLVFASAAIYFVHYLIFHDAHHIFIYMVGDIAFVPIEVLMVTVIIHRLLSIREKRALLQKLNMVIGVFFAEAGTRMLREFARMDPGLQQVGDRWTDGDFAQVRERLRGYSYDVEPSREGLAWLKGFFEGKREVILRLLENPNLLEHESFTDMLWAVVHLAEELDHREAVPSLPDSDVDHLGGDIKRAYSRLVMQWLDYMQHLRSDYPYLFSLAIRTNPFVPGAKAEVT